jgi:hypothetical protein
MPRVLTTLMLAAAATLGLAGSAIAKPAPASAGCAVDSMLSTPFLPWGDTASYALAPGANFEAGASGWTLKGGARVVAGNEAFKVGGARDAASLLLPAHAVATSPPMCVDITYPFFRFFAAGSPSGNSPLRVDVLFLDDKGRAKVANHGQIRAASASWFLTDSIELGLRFDDTVVSQRVAFRFTARGNGAWRVDDVYVDPFAKR